MFSLNENRCRERLVKQRNFVNEDSPKLLSQIALHDSSHWKNCIKTLKTTWIWLKLNDIFRSSRRRCCEESLAWQRGGTVLQSQLQPRWAWFTSHISRILKTKILKCKNQIVKRTKQLRNDSSVFGLFYACVMVSWNFVNKMNLLYMATVLFKHFKWKIHDKDY